jgi:hypothetical protein
LDIFKVFYEEGLSLPSPLLAVLIGAANRAQVLIQQLGNEVTLFDVEGDDPQ